MRKHPRWEKRGERITPAPLLTTLANSVPIVSDMNSATYEAEMFLTLTCVGPLCSLDQHGPNAVQMCGTGTIRFGWTG